MKRFCVSIAVASCLLLAISCNAGDSTQGGPASEESSASPSPASEPSAPSAEVPAESSRQQSAPEEAYSSGRRLKKLTELSAEELEVIKGLCAKVLKDELGGAVSVWEDTTFYYLPTSEDGFSRGEKLANPVTLVSASIISAYDMRELRRRLKARLSTLAARHEGKGLRRPEMTPLSFSGPSTKSWARTLVRPSSLSDSSISGGQS